VPEQVISSKPNVWMRTPYPVTLVGDITWDDYTVGTDVLLQDAGQVALGGSHRQRVQLDQAAALEHLDGLLRVARSGRSVEARGEPAPGQRQQGGDQGVGERHGGGFDPTPGTASSWTSTGDAITAVLDGHDLATVHDATYAAGQTGFAVDTWARATFEDYAATPHA
jgi:hypothetical protein